jgi:Ni/Co efflux regulator RcnB
MRKLLFSILLASAAATPALAGPRDFTDQTAARSDRQAARAERQQSRDDARSERSNDRSSSFTRPDRPDRSSDSQPVDRSARVQPNANTIVDTTRANIDSARAGRDAARLQRIDQRQQTVEERQQAIQQVRDNRDLRQQSRPPLGMRNRPPVVSNTPHEGTQPPPPAVSRPTAAPTWSTSWRHDSKYDWYNWRKRHRSLFHFGFYYDPFGWGYYPFQIGWRLWPSYYSSNYWINDPWQYRLPYAPPGYVWIRYWNDALLVDTWSGQVVDMIPNFFW